MYQTDMYEGMLAETVTIPGAGGDLINAYFARPLGPGPFPGVVLIHHMPGWDEWYREATRKFAAPRLCCALAQPVLPRRPRHARGCGGQSARSRRRARRSGRSAIWPARSRYLRSLPYVNGKVGVFGTCSGGRHAYLAACRITGFDAVVDCWGGRVVMAKEDLTPKQPVAPIDYTTDLPARSWACSARKIAAPRPSRWRYTNRSSRGWARTTNSTCTPTPDTAFSTTTAQPTARNRRWMAGTRSLRFWGGYLG